MNSRNYSKSIAETLVIACDEIIFVMDIESTKMTNTIAIKVSINSHNKKVRYKIDSYILHTVSLVMILLLTIAIICYYYAKLIKTKDIDVLIIQKWKKMNLKMFVLKIVRVIV